MGFLDWNDGASVLSTRSSHRRHRSSRSHKKRRSRSRSRSSSPDRGRSFAGSIFGGDRYGKHNSSRASFFGLGGGNNSRSSFFGNSRSSYYKRSPRQGFIQKTYKQLKRLLRDLVHWAKRHPWKVFFLVIMPLVSGGVLTALLARFGLRIPAGIERMLGVASKAATGDSVGLVGEAVRMASNFGGSGGVRVDKAREPGFDFESKMSYGGDAGGWASNLMGSGMGGVMGGAMGGGLMDMAKKWM